MDIAGSGGGPGVGRNGVLWDPGRVSKSSVAVRVAICCDLLESQHEASCRDR